ncbi:carbonic anhydrase-like isoform X2 [Chelonus insularis]|uniref:carbonic anhydrase-like isoform X2 n=1 Tax=Chelonus insularis TaxID=460826 RepID=UPI0015886B1F|nr:carbonic anhydrase-like isoform X2 [Chelonus insularis]
MFFVLTTNFILVIFNSFQALADYDYKNPDSWSVEHAECYGRMQSPIDIDLFVNSGQQHWYNNLVFFNYHELPTMAKLLNDGHTLKIEFEWNHFAPQIHGGPLHDVYQLENLHFHWNTNHHSGSEHKINGESFPLEMHMVHFNRRYNSYSNALNYRDGLAVVAVMFALSSEDQSLLLSKILANSSENYAVYFGSLTTPPCTEGVAWFVSLQPLPVSTTEMHKFRSLQLANNDDHNNRPIQPRNGRSINIIESYF